MRVAHFAFDLRARDQRRHRVDDDDVDGVGADQHLGDLQSLLAGIGLRHQQLVDIDPELAGVADVQGVLRVDERRDAACALRVRDHVQAEGGLAARLRPVDLADPPPRHAADSGRRIQIQRTGGDGFDLNSG